MNKKDHKHLMKTVQTIKEILGPGDYELIENLKYSYQYQELTSVFSGPCGKAITSIELKDKNDNKLYGEVVTNKNELFISGDTVIIKKP